MSVPVSGPIDLSGQAAMVTGAARGIGQAICRALAREGADVACCDILPTGSTAELVKAQGRQALEIHCDVRSPEQVQNAIDHLMDHWGRIDILVNSAGILGNSRQPMEELSVDDWDLVLEVNLRGAFLVLQAAWPHLLKRGCGKIVLLGSIAGRVGGLLAGPPYCASKGGIHALVKWAAKKGAPLGIYVNGIAPGPIATPMTQDEPYHAGMVPLGRLGEPEDIAEAALFLASQSSNFITGNVLDVNGGMLMV